MSENRTQAAFAALILTFAGLGDAFLYAALPNQPALVDAPLLFIGVLLSVNRFIRLLANPLFAFLFRRFGFRHITLAAAILSAVTTLTYGITTNLGVWIAARILWGFCFSALRITAISYTLRGKNQGLLAGLSRSLQETGPAIALLTGPLLLQWFDVRTTFLIFTILSLPAVWISFRLRDFPPESARFVFKAGFLPSPLNLLTFASAFLIQGILVAGLTALLRQSGDAGVALPEVLMLSGMLLAFRRLSLMVFSPFGGWVGDIWGIRKTFGSAQLLSIVGLLLIAQQFTAAGCLLAFTFQSIALTLSPGLAAAEGENRLKAVAANGTSTDMGAAAGVLFAGSLLPHSDFRSIFLAGSLALVVIFLFYIRRSGAKVNGILQWK